MEIRDYLYLLKKWAWLLILGAVLGTVSGYFFSTSQQPVYQSTTKFLVQQSPENRMPDSYAIYTELQLAKTYSQILVTDPILEKTSQVLGYPVSAGQIKVQLKQDTQIIQVDVTDSDPQHAADIANILIATFTQQNEDIQSSRYASSEQTLQAQIQQVEAQIQEIQNEINNVSTESLKSQQEQVNAQISALQTTVAETKTNINNYLAKGEENLTDAEKLQLEEERARLNQSQGLLNLYQQIYLNIVSKGETTGTTSASTRISQLQSNLTLYQQIYSSLLTNYESIRLARLKSTPNIVQIEQAKPASSPIRPKPVTDSMLSGIVGLFLAAGIAFLVEYMDTTIKTPDQVMQLLHLPVIGFVPEFTVKSKSKRVFLIANPRSPLGEAYRSLRINVEFSASTDSNLKTILLTSPVAGEGKTSTSVNLAYMFANSGKKVVLLDGDLHRPMVHQYLKIPNRNGFTDLFRSKLAVQQVAHIWRLNNFTVIPSGPLPPNPAELLGSQKMGQILNLLKTRADIIVIDSPPRLVADATILARLVDAVILVVQPGKTKIKHATNMIEEYRRLNIRVLGVVFNRIPQKMSYSYAQYAPYAAYKHYYGDNGQAQDTLVGPTASKRKPTNYRI